MPDGRGFAFGDVRTGTPNLWYFPIGGGPQKQLTHFTSGVLFGSRYSPDGKWIVVARGTNQNDAVLFTNSK